ncbi:MAG: 7-carboxy-7-deazaguanine synthase QueE, partial [Selenomonadaceae bacterium]|nr:7-carboxy-7-deazaguanine synthase QueE [Selenomonadaceae bacterium]
FLQAARDLDLYIKLVVSAETTDEEFQRAVQLVAMHAPDKLFILQPVTPNDVCHAATPERVLYLQNLALQSLDDVRVIPQTHKMIGQM